MDKMCDGIRDLWSKANWMGGVYSTLGRSEDGKHKLERLF